MNLLNSQNPKHYSSKHNKKRLTQDQVRLLEASFNYNKRLEPHHKLQLARELAIPPRQIAIWYQNKRARWKTQSLELDYNMLQIRLEAALAEKKKFEKESQRLRVELQKAQEMLIGLKQGQTHPSLNICSISSCCDEGGSSSLHDDVNCSWVNDEILQVEDLYACLMGANGSNCG